MWISVRKEKYRVLSVVSKGIFFGRDWVFLVREIFEVSFFELGFDGWMGVN